MVKTIQKSLPVILIVLIGALLRLYNIENLTTFSGDQGYDFLIVKKMTEGDFTLLGPKIGPYNEIGNLYLGPAYYYLLTPALFIFRFDPIGAAYLTATLAILTVALVYKFSSEFFSKQIGLLAAFLYATSAFLITQSRASSNPHMLPFFSIVFLYGLFKSTKERSMLWPLASGFSLGIMFQLHYLSAAIIPVALIALGFKKFKKLLLLSAAFILAISPQILFELRNQFFITNLFQKQIESGQNISSIGRFWDHLVLSSEKISSIFLNQASLAIPALLITSVVFAYFVFKDKKSRKISISLIVSVFLAALAASLFSGNIEPHYFAYVYPQLSIILAIVFLTIFNSFSNFFIKGILVLLLIQLIAQNLQSLNLKSPQGYTMPAGWNQKGIKKAAQIIAEDKGSSEIFNVAATLDGDTRARPLRYMVETYGKTPQDVEKYPTSTVIYLVTRDDQNAVKSYTVWEIDSFKPFSITGDWEIQNGIKLYKLEKQKT